MGAGSSGSVVAARLSEDGRNRVLLLTAGGPLAVSHIRSLHPLSRVLVETCVKAGVPFREGINAPPQMAAGYVQATQRRGRRHSTSRAYLWPARGRDNLRIVSHAQALGLKFDGTCAVGVGYVRRGKRKQASAAKAIVLCAGARKKGHDAMAVVNDGLKVRGLEGLYVADASIMPTVVGANTNATCIIIGERAAEIIRSAA